MATPALRFAVSVKGDLPGTLTRLEKPIARASTAAMREAGATLKAEARADIGAAGFSTKWQNALRVDTFPRTGTSIEAAAFLHHKISYSGIFEKGGTITGKPFLWLPLSKTPLMIGRFKLTPKRYAELVGPLAFVDRGGRPPLLVARQARTRGGGRHTLRSLARGAAGGKSVALFIGIPLAKLRKRFHIREIANAVAGRVRGLFFQHLNPEE